MAAVNDTIILYLTVMQKSIPVPALDKLYSSLFEENIEVEHVRPIG